MKARGLEKEDTAGEENAWEETGKEDKRRGGWKRSKKRRRGRESMKRRQGEKEEEEEGSERNYLAHLATDFHFFCLIKLTSC